MSSSCTLFLTCFPARAECCGCLLVAWEVSDKKGNCVSADTDSCKGILHARQEMPSFHRPGTIIIQMDEWMCLKWHVDVKNGFSGENSMETLKPRLSKYRFQRHDSVWNSPGMWLFVSTKWKGNLFGSHTRQLSLSGSLLSLRSVRLPPEIPSWLKISPCLVLQEPFHTSFKWSRRWWLILCKTLTKAEWCSREWEPQESCGQRGLLCNFQ